MVAAQGDAKLREVKFRSPKIISLQDTFVSDLQIWPPAVSQPFELKGCVVSHLKVQSKDQLLFTRKECSNTFSGEEFQKFLTKGE